METDKDVEAGTTLQFYYHNIDSNMNWILLKLLW